MAKKAQKKSKESNNDIMDFLLSELGSKDNLIMSSDSADSLIPWKIPFRHKGLQKITGGLLGGKMMEIQGDSQTAKSFLMYELFASCIDMGGLAYLRDAEQAYEPAYGEKIGIKGGLFYSSNTNLESAFSDMMKFIEAARKKIKDKSIPIVLGLDSFPALRTNKQMEDDDKGKDGGYSAMRKNMVFYDKLTAIQPMLSEYAASLIVLNQTRKDHTIVYGDNTKSLADNMKYYMTQRLRGKLSTKLVRENKATEEKVQTGMTVQWQCIKNRFVEPFQKVKVETLFRSGLKVNSGLIDLLLNDEVITKHMKTATKKDGSEGKKQVEAYNVVGTEDYYMESELEKMLADHPQLLDLRLTKHVDESTYEDKEEAAEGSEE